MIAALIAQESTFDPEARSSANAWGLMQLVPATGRRLARSVGIRRFRTAMLTQPDVNIRLGTTYFARLVDQFGGVHLALASYNAGESRVVRWVAERPGLERDEFIDDIPFPETQNYVKRILGTAEDYRIPLRTAVIRLQVRGIVAITRESLPRAIELQNTVGQGSHPQRSIAVFQHRAHA